MFQWESLSVTILGVVSMYCLSRFCKIRSAPLKGVTVLLAEDGQAMLKSRAALPMAAVKDQLLSKIKENEVVVVGGETGCGKTTQVYTFSYDILLFCS